MEGWRIEGVGDGGWGMEGWGLEGMGKLVDGDGGGRGSKFIPDCRPDQGPLYVCVCAFWT